MLAQRFWFASGTLLGLAMPLAAQASIVTVIAIPKLR